MHGVLHPALPERRGGQHQRLQRIKVDHRVDAPLVEQAEGQHQCGTPQQMGEVVGQGAEAMGLALHHAKPWLTNKNTTARSASKMATPRNCGTRITRILAIDTSRTDSPTPSRKILI